jgi:hypothetical protein
LQHAQNHGPRTQIGFISNPLCLRFTHEAYRRRLRFMSGWLIALCGAIYAGVALDQALHGNWPMCIVYSGYSFSNIGLYALAK